MTPARCRNVKEVGQGFVLKLTTEAPVNGGRNYDGPKVNVSSLALVKLGYMLESLSIQRYHGSNCGDNAIGAGNQQETYW
jgi:hypothetical protein